MHNIEKITIRNEQHLKEKMINEIINIIVNEIIKLFSNNNITISEAHEVLHKATQLIQRRINQQTIQFFQ